jgi:Ice-binding-like
MHWPSAVYASSDKDTSTLTTTTNSTVTMINGGQPCDVLWQVGSSATIGKANMFAGNILALASSTLMTGADLAGRALARTGAVTMGTNDVAVGSCANGRREKANTELVRRLLLLGYGHHAHSPEASCC